MYLGFLFALLAVAACISQSEFPDLTGINRLIIMGSFFGMLGSLSLWIFEKITERKLEKEKNKENNEQ